MMKRFFAILWALFGLVGAARAEDGYDLWLRYRPLDAGYVTLYQKSLSSVVVSGSSDTMGVVRQELSRGLGGLLGAVPTFFSTPIDGALVVGTPTSSPLIASLDLGLKAVGTEGYVIRTVRHNGLNLTIIAANTDVGTLYGTFAYLKRLQTHQPITDLSITDQPRLKLRVLNHWDNIDGSVERGYSGASIWDWWKLPDIKSPRYADYGRANASIGINGTVVNNVNSRAISLSPDYIYRTKGIADALRPYGIKVYLSVRFNAPMELGGLKTADPLDPEVRAWWKAKAQEIYSIIPDFGGFLVKANSEGQPGPQDYGRNHADGANMLAEAIAPYGGIVMWRAFVYSHENPDDRHKQAYNEFVPLDGKFAPNVLVQVKNGAIDFQPREPFHPLFGAMPKTPLMMEFQITKEYIGFATHLAYLGPYYQEALRADTFAKGKKGAFVSKVIDGRLDQHALTGMAGVANIGTDRNWSGSHMDQANWYVFGRMAWNPDADSRSVAEDWLKMTFVNDANFVAPMADMMMGSREAVADYMTPLGLTHLMATGHHYGPGPWVADLARPEWNPVYYHKANASGIGFDRLKTGSNAIAQYSPKAQKAFVDPAKMDERYLLWFHHLSWDYRVKSGRTLWDELVITYGTGVKKVQHNRQLWQTMKPYVDAERFADIDAAFAVQEREAQWWRDASVAYFMSLSKRPLPAGEALPAHDLDYYKSIKFTTAPGN